MPKLTPLIVTEVPTAPDAGFRLIMFGEEPPSEGGLLVDETKPAQELRKRTTEIVSDKTAPTLGW